MPSHTIVAAFDTHAHADLAIADLSAAGISPACIKHYTNETKSAITETDMAPATAKPSGLWAWLTGEGVSSGDHTLYDRSIERGHTVVTVIASDENAERISSILEEHAPLDFERLPGEPEVPGMRLKRYTAVHPVEEQMRLRDSSQVVER